MNTSRQKLEMDEVCRNLHLEKESLEYKIKILKIGMYAIDEGRDMISEKSALASEVRNIMLYPHGTGE